MVGHHVLGHVLVADVGLLGADAQGLTGLVQAQVGHDRGDDGVAVELAGLLEVLAAEEEDVVAVDDLALLVHRQATVGVTVVGKARVEAVVHDVLLQALDMGTAAVVVDVDAVGLVVDHIDLGAQGLVDRTGDVPRGAVGAVEAHLHAVESARGDAHQIADVTVAASRIVDHVAHVLARGVRDLAGLAVEVGLDQRLDLGLDLLPVGAHDLDAVVVEGVVRRADHHAAVEVGGAAAVADAGRGGHVQQVCVGARGGDAAGEGVLERVGAAARVFADHDAGAPVLVLLPVVPADVTAHLEGLLGRQHDVSLAAESISPEILAHGSVLLLR